MYLLNLITSKKCKSLFYCGSSPSRLPRSHSSLTFSLPWLLFALAFFILLWLFFLPFFFQVFFVDRKIFYPSVYKRLLRLHLASPLLGEEAARCHPCGGSLRLHAQGESLVLLPDCRLVNLLLEGSLAHVVFVRSAWSIKYKTCPDVSFAKFSWRSPVRGS